MIPWEAGVAIGLICGAAGTVFGALLMALAVVGSWRAEGTSG